MLRAILLAAAAIVMPATAQPLDPANPFAKPSALPYQAPAFDRIKDSDYQPAIEAGMAAQRAEVRAIADDPSPPTFDNTLVALERSGQLLSRAAAAFNAVAQANTNPTLQAVKAALGPQLAAHSDAIYQDQALFGRVKWLHDHRATLKLDGEQAMLLEQYHQAFLRAGAQLGGADQAALRELNKRISGLMIEFQRRLLAGTKAGALVVDDAAALAGLTPAEIAAAAGAARARGLDGKYVLPLQNTTQQPALKDLSDRATREKLFAQSWLRTSRDDANDTRATLIEIALLRARKAKLLGYPTWADYILTDQMAKTAPAANAFLAKLGPPLAIAQRRDAAEIQARIDASARESGIGGFKAQPWDWQLYAEQIRKARYDLDEGQLKPYFEIWTVLTKGVFFAAHELYGVSFKERRDIPVYDPDMRVFEVFEEDGRPLGLMYFDYWKRDNKAGGAWNGSFIGASALFDTKTAGYNVANFAKPAPGQPQLITSDDVRTMFHEFGHALHGLFTRPRYPRLRSTARDFAEYPSQFNEHWAWDPKVLASYAVHYQTGAAMPAALVEKIRRADTFDQGYAEGELLAAAKLDLAWYSIPDGTTIADADAFEAKALAATGLATDIVPPRYRSSYFSHIFDGGYSAGYYGYIWTDMLEEDSFDWFRAHGGMTRANGQRFRDLVLSRGHTQDYGDIFRAFRGRDPDIRPLLVSHGLAKAESPR